MVEYSFRDGDRILQNLIKSDDKGKGYRLSNHLKSRANLRNINLNYLENMLLNEEPLGVLSSRKTDSKFSIQVKTANIWI